MARSHTGRSRMSPGFTLIELMIVVAIVSILAAIAYPSYQNAIRTARRADAMDALLTLQSLQEKYRANNTTYGTFAQIGGSTAFPDDTSIDGYYDLAVTLADATKAVAYTLTTTAKGTQLKDTYCAKITLAISATKPRGESGGTHDDCWRN